MSCFLTGFCCWPGQRVTWPHWVFPSCWHARTGVPDWHAERRDNSKWDSGLRVHQLLQVCPRFWSIWLAICFLSDSTVVALSLIVYLLYKFSYKMCFPFDPTYDYGASLRKYLQLWKDDSIRILRFLFILRFHEFMMLLSTKSNTF